MKKFLLSATLLGGAILGVNAQTLTFQYQGQDLEDGASIVYDGYEEDTMGYDDYVNYKIDPKIFILSDIDDYVNITVDSNVAINLCAGGLCTTGTNVEKPNVFLESDVPLDLQLDYDVDSTPGEVVEFPEINLVIKAWYVDYPEVMITLNVKMGGFAGVESLISNNNVNINGKVLSYNFNKASDITLYSLSGKTLMQKTVSGNGSINLNSLPAGVYVYKVNGSISKTGKFIVK